MGINIAEKLKKKEKKTQVNFTLDKTLLDDLLAFKEKHKIDYLSPMVNEMLKDWLHQQEKNHNK